MRDNVDDWFDQQDSVPEGHKGNKGPSAQNTNRSEIIILHENLASLDRSLMTVVIEKAASAGRVHLQDELLTNLIKLKIIQSGKPTFTAMLLFGIMAILSIWEGLRLLS